MEKALCYVPIVSSATLWERNIPQTILSPHHGRTLMPCTRYINHMKNFSDSYKFSSLRFLQFPERTGGPVACKRLLNAREYLIPRITENINCLEEECCEETTSSPTPSKEMDENTQSATDGKNKKKTKENPKKAWSSPYLENQMANRHIRQTSSKPIHLEAAGRHLSLHQQFPNASMDDTDSKQRPFTAIGLYDKKQAPYSQQKTRRTVSEPKLEENVTVTYPDLQSGTLVATGHAVGKVKVALTPEKLSKPPHHLYIPEDVRLKADTSLPSNLAIAPLPVLQGGTCTHFPSKRLIKVCTSAPPRTPRRFHKSCSQTLTRPVVHMASNAHLD